MWAIQINTLNPITKKWEWTYMRNSSMREGDYCTFPTKAEAEEIMHICYGKHPLVRIKFLGE